MTDTVDTGKPIKIICHNSSYPDWVEVEVKVLEELAIYDDISSFSYIGEERAFLEDSADASLLFDTMDERNIKYDIEIRYSNKLHWIHDRRKWEHF